MVAFCPVGVSGDVWMSFGEMRLSVLISIISSLYSSLGGLVDGCRDSSAAIKWITLLAVIGGGSGSGRNVGISDSICKTTAGKQYDYDCCCVHPRQSS